MDCEVLFPKISRRGRIMMQAMIDAAPKVGVRCIVTETYRRKANLLMSYGLGHLERRRGTEAHVAAGGRLIGWDLGYWDRESAMRVTVDSGHPKAMPDMPADRWSRSGISLREDFNPKGPIILVGMGHKSRAQFGYEGQAWELGKLKQIQRQFPGHRVLYRPKKPESWQASEISVGSVEAALRGASLVVCRHSNVAVDACIAGVPVVCEDGAAAALYGSDLSNPVIPDREARLRFLQNLAWWQYRPEEAVMAWKFLIKVIRDS